MERENNKNPVISVFSPDYLRINPANKSLQAIRQLEAAIIVAGLVRNGAFPPLEYNVHIKYYQEDHEMQGIIVGSYYKWFRFNQLMKPTLSA